MAQPITTQIGENETLPLFANTGFTNPNGVPFACWNTERDGSGQIFLDGQKMTNVVAGPMNLYAQWGHLVQWDSQGGTAAEPYFRQLGEEVGTLPTSTKSGYVLDGWYSQPSGGGFKLLPTTTVSQNATYYAKWNGLVYTVTNPDSLSAAGAHANSCKMFTNKPKGTYRLVVNKLGLWHGDSKTSHEMHFYLRVENSANDNQTKPISMTSSNTTIEGSSAGISFDTIRVSVSLDGGTVQTDTVGAIRGTGYGNGYGSGYFTLTVNNIQFPYAKTTLKFCVSSDSNCTGGAFLRFSNGNQDAKITLRRL